MDSKTKSLYPKVKLKAESLYLKMVLKTKSLYPKMGPKTKSLYLEMNPKTKSLYFEMNLETKSLYSKMVSKFEHLNPNKWRVTNIGAVEQGGRLWACPRVWLSARLFSCRLFLLYQDFIPTHFLSRFVFLCLKFLSDEYLGSNNDEERSEVW